MKNPFSQMTDVDWGLFEGELIKRGLSFVLDNIQAHKRLMWKSNQVTAPHRHGNSQVAVQFIDELYDRQLMSEQSFGGKIPPSWIDEIQEQIDKDELLVKLFRMLDSARKEPGEGNRNRILAAMAALRPGFIPEPPEAQKGTTDGCICDAQWSGRDDAKWQARGCPSCTCGRGIGNG